MLEILALIKATRWLADVAKGRGHSGMWGGLAPLFWIGGEFFGAIVAVLIGITDTLPIYGVALLVAALSLLVAWGIVTLLPRRELVFEDLGGPATNPHYDPRNPYSPPQFRGEGYMATRPLEPDRVPARTRRLRKHDTES